MLCENYIMVSFLLRLSVHIGAFPSVGRPVKWLSANSKWACRFSMYREKKHVVVWMLTSKSTVWYFVLENQFGICGSGCFGHKTHMLNFTIFLINHVCWQQIRAPVEIHLNLSVFGRSFTIDFGEFRFGPLVHLFIVVSVSLLLLPPPSPSLYKEQRKNTNCWSTSWFFLQWIIDINVTLKNLKCT